MQGATSYQSLENSEDCYSPMKSKCRGLLDDSADHLENDYKNTISLMQVSQSNSTSKSLSGSVCEETDHHRVCCSCQSCCSSFFFKLKTSSTCQYIVLWLWLISASVIIGLILWGSVFSTLCQQALALGDQLLIDINLTPVFCKNVILESNGEFNAGLISYKPSISKNSIRKQVINGSDSFVNYFSLNYHLLEDSHATIKILTKDNIDFYIIEGYENYSKWKKYKGCFDCYMVHIKNCTLTFESKFAFRRTSSYYFIINNQKNELYKLNEVFFHIILYRTSYKTNGVYARNCQNVLNCTLDYNFFSSDNLLFESVFKGTNHSDNADVEIKCGIRAFGYVLFFGLVPFVFGLLISLIISSKITCRRNNRGDADHLIDGSMIDGMIDGMIIEERIQSRESILELENKKYDFCNKSKTLNGDDYEDHWSPMFEINHI